MSSIKITDNVYWVGVKDPNLVVFDIIMPTKYGTTYNAYLVKGEKIALIDTVKAEFTDEYFANIEEITPLETIDYLIVNHTEPDHSGAMKELLKRAPNIQIVCANTAKAFVQNVLNAENNFTGLKDNALIELGGKTLLIKQTPYMHWPDTMMEYLQEDKILFSCDGFAGHISTDTIFEDELSDEFDIEYEVSYYFDSIMRPYTGQIRKNLAKFHGLDIKTVAPSHGPIFRRDPWKYINKYMEWSRDKTEGVSRVSIFYASSYGNTKKLAERAAGVLDSAGYKVELQDVTEIEKPQAQELIESSKAIMIGTPTFNGDAVKPIWEFINLFSTVDIRGKKAAVFGSYGWSGEGAKLVAGRLDGMKIRVYPDTFRTRLIPSDDDLAEIKTFTRGFIDFVNAN